MEMEGEEWMDKIAITTHDLDNVPRTKDVALKQVAPFSKMVLSDDLQKGLRSCGFLFPTLIQETAIPFGRSGMDLIVQSKSGTGKTLIFCCIILEAYKNSVVGPQSLIVVPTREIAVQIVDVLNTLSKYFKEFRAVAVIGGLDVLEDRKRLQTARSVVGTPGRILHLMRNNVLNTAEIKIFVLDEVDRLFTSSFYSDVQRIRESLKACKQIVVCSATLSDDLNNRLSKVMRNPLTVCNQGKAVLLRGIKQFVYELPDCKTSILEMKSKLEALRFILARLSFNQCVLFARTHSRANSYYNYLKKAGWPCEFMTGGLDQKTRLMTFQNFRKCKIRILIATDLMSRGVDFLHVNLVINLELPNDMITYLHRIGRAGRFGSHGLAINLISSTRDYQQLTQIINGIGKHMKMYRFPINAKQQSFDEYLWDFSSSANDVKHFGVFNAETYLNSNERKEEMMVPASNTTETISIDSKTFLMDQPDDDAAYRLQNEKPHVILTTSPSCYNSSQYLVSSNTIDDASSIAVDSSLSNDAALAKPSVSMEKLPASKLVKFLVDANQTEADLKTQNGIKSQTTIANLFEVYAEQVLHNTNTESTTALSPSEVSSESLNSSKLTKLKNLLIEKSDGEQQPHISDYYAEFNDICKAGTDTSESFPQKSLLNGCNDNTADLADNDDNSSVKDLSTNASDQTLSSAIVPSPPDVTPQNTDAGVQQKFTMNKASQVTAGDIPRLENTSTTVKLQMASAMSGTNNKHPASPTNRKVVEVTENCTEFIKDTDETDDVDDVRQPSAEQMDTNNEDNVLDTEYYTGADSHESEDELCYYTDTATEEQHDESPADEEECEDEWRNSSNTESESNEYDEADESLDEYGSSLESLSDNEEQESADIINSEDDYIFAHSDSANFDRFAHIFNTQYQFIRNYVSLSSNHQCSGNFHTEI